jgi:glycosyltransferase involved in cell wall biosynthesis
MTRLIFFLLLLLFPFFSEGKETICLNMIVKNEKDVIRRCLDSVIPLIDYWVIVDTGSKDGTQEIIREHLKNIPGELYERPWKNFGENRTEAFELAKGKSDYILFMDADDVLEYEPGFQFSNLTHDVYNMWRGSKGYSYQKPQLARGDLPWRWVGVTHEYLDCPIPHSSDLFTDVKYVTLDGGATRKNPREKFIRNVKLLKEGLLKEPKNVRYVFYLAESYRDAGEKAKSVEWFQKRVDMGGWAEEVFWSKLQIAHMIREIGLPLNIVIDCYKDAHQFRPHRIEPIYYLAELYNQNGNYQKAFECIKANNFIPKPEQKDILFNEDWIDEYGLLFQLSICSYYIGLYNESIKACDALLAMKELPESFRKQTEMNRRFPLAKLQEIAKKENISKQ